MNSNGHRFAEYWSGRVTGTSLRRSIVVFAILTFPCILSIAGHSLQTVPAPQTTAIAQQPSSDTPGSVTGTVMDGTGATVVGATVLLTSGTPPSNREARSGDDGQFSFAEVAPGDFKLTIAAPGFAPRNSSGVLHPGEFYIAPSSVLSLATANTSVEVVPASEVAERQIKAQEKQRVLAVFPNFYVSYVPDAAPLNSKQKFKLAARTTIDPVTGAFAGVQQAMDDYDGYGQGAEGYGKRFGAAYADTVTDTFLEGAVLASLFKQDPRYFYKGIGSTRSRMLRAVGSVVVCKGDNQHWQPNYSGILGGVAAGGISNLYYPEKDRGAALTFENALIGTGTAAVVNLIQEFVVKKFTKNVPPPNSSTP